MTEYRRQYPTLPAAEHLTPRLVELHAEADTVWTARTESIAELQRLFSDDTERVARDADRDAAAEAIRAGKPGGSVGTPAVSALVEARNALVREIDAAVVAMVSIERDMTVEFEKIQTDDAASGRDALKVAEKKYAKAIAGLLSARAGYMQVRGVHDFLAGAAGVPSFGAFAWPPKPPLVAINTLSTTGERDYHMRPVTAEHVIAQTFAVDLDRSDQ